MMEYNKEIFPELTEHDFNLKIKPISDQFDLEKLLGNLKSMQRVHLKFHVSKSREKYPYENVCMSLVKNIWVSSEKRSMEKFFVDSNSSQGAIYEQFSQIAFSYLIRCFAKQIKSFSNSNLTPEKKYFEYCNELINSDFYLIRSEYPIAWNRCIEHITKGISSIENVVNKIEKHRDDIESIFGIKKRERIKSIIPSGDTHNGSAVMIIQFEKEGKLIFKPRSMSGEENYSIFIKQINELLDENLQAILSKNYGDYGFAEFIVNDGISSDMEDVGKMACIMYLLNASDMHYSNVFQTKRGPVPIDLETLFQPQRVRTGKVESSKSAYLKLEKSVYGTGILPISLGKNKNNNGMDVGFAGIRNADNESPLKKFDLIDGYTSKIRVVWQKREHELDNHLSIDKEFKKNMISRSQLVCKGFSELYRKVLKNKNTFLKIVLSTFKDSKLRYIHNMTYRYEQILRILTAPTPSQSKNIAKALLCRLGILSMTSDINIVLSEIRQIWTGDIPFFETHFNQKNIYSNGKIISKLLKTPAKAVTEKITSINNSDLNTQLNLIKLAFVATISDDENGNESVSYKKEPRTNKTEIVINNLTESLVNTILDDRFEHLPKTWIGPVAQGNGKGWSPGVLGYDLYSGRTGIALVLALVGVVTDNRKAEAISRNIFERSIDILNSNTFELRNVLQSGTGAFSGITGLFWSLNILGKLLKENGWIDTSRKYLSLIDNSLTFGKNNFYDLISGPSGSLVMRARIQKDFKLSEKDIENIISQSTKSNLLNSHLTSGIAHGLGQKIWFLSILYQYHKDKRIKQIIIETHKIIQTSYKRKGFTEIYPHQTTSELYSSSTWCNGTSGLLIAYYEGYKAGCLEREDVIEVLRELKKIPSANVPILCHGSLGIYDSVNYIKKDFNLETKAFLNDLNKTICSTEYISHYFENSTGRYSLSPGLMSGKAGALLFLIKKLNLDIKISPLTITDE